MLTELFLATVDRCGGLPAVEDDRVSLSYRRLAVFARVMRDWVEQTTSCDRVALMLPASASFCGCLFGVLWSGRACVPLNFLLSADELARVVDASGVDVVLTVTAFAPLVRALPVRVVYLDKLPLKRRMLTAGMRKLPAAPRVGAGDTAVLLFTSGTSGDPKGVELTQSNLHSNCMDCIATAGMQPDHRFLNCLPPFHVFGLTCDVIVPVALGAAAYCVPRFSPAAVARTITDKRVSIMLAIPSMYRAILRLRSATPDLFRDAYLLISGGEPLSDALREQFCERFAVRIFQGYGLSETSPVCTLETPSAQRAGTIGRPIRNVAVRITDDENQPLGVNQEGEILIKGPNVMKGYFRDEPGTRKAITPDGWFRTGDAGFVDEDGFVTITGRLKDIIIVGGENVHPVEVEQVLESHADVAEAAVVGAEDASRGEVPVAFVLLKEGGTATEADLRAYARTRLAGYKTPRRVVIRDDLPRGPTGKILKRKLRDLL